jgi:hypothetical protein
MFRMRWGSARRPRRDELQVAGEHDERRRRAPRGGEHLRAIRRRAREPGPVTTTTVARRRARPKERARVRTVRHEQDDLPAPKGFGDRGALASRCRRPTRRRPCAASRELAPVVRDEEGIPEALGADRRGRAVTRVEHVWSGSVSTCSRMDAMRVLKSPPGRSVRPIEPWKTTSPTSAKLVVGHEDHVTRGVPRREAHVERARPEVEAESMRTSSSVGSAARRRPASRTSPPAAASPGTWGAPRDEEDGHVRERAPDLVDALDVIDVGMGEEMATRSSPRGRPPRRCRGASAPGSTTAARSRSADQQVCVLPEPSAGEGPDLHPGSPDVASDVKELPHPQPPEALGLRNVKPWPIMLET